MGMVCPSEAIPLTIDPRLSRQTKGEPWSGEANITPTKHDAPKRCRSFHETIPTVSYNHIHSINWAEEGY